MVRLRLDRRLQGRIDSSDVLQEAYLEVANSIANYSSDPSIPFYVWLRTITVRKLMALSRRHLGAQIRDAHREKSIDNDVMPGATSETLAAQLLGRHSTPSKAAMRAEMKGLLQDALNGMDPIDREVLALRHFEELNNTETAQVLGITRQAASNRYVRALERLREFLTCLNGPAET